MNVIIGNSWPYANGPLHLGRIAVLLPGDIIARYHRLMGDNVIFVSGTDCHGDIVAARALEEGISLEEVVEKYHNQFGTYFKRLGFSFDIFTKTHCEYHEQKVKNFILDLYNKNYIYENEVGEEKHLFFTLSEFEADIEKFISEEFGWRDSAKRIVCRYLEGGLRDKAVTKVCDWGIDVPLDGYDDKKIFVWIEAVMGYLTASMKIIEERGEDTSDYWSGDDSRVYFVHGKDNIPFHSVILPAIISAMGFKNSNIRIVSSEHLKLEGKNFSAIKNWAIWVDEIVKNYDIDMIRYYLIATSPENRNTNFTWRSFVNTTNNNLVGELGQFVNRTLTIIEKSFDSYIPKGIMNEEFKNTILNLYCDLSEKIEMGEIQSSLEDIFTLIKEGNRYFQMEKTWITIHNDTGKCRNTIYTCVQIIVNIANLLEPFMPFTCEKIRKFLKIELCQWRYMEKESGKINKFEVLFKKLDKSIINEELLRLKYKN